MAGRKPMKKDTKQEIYRIIDSFLVEAKGQNGRERSLEQLNRDRHLAAEKFEELIEELIEQGRQEIIDKVVEILKKLQKTSIKSNEIKELLNFNFIGRNFETDTRIFANDIKKQILSDAIEKIKFL